MARDPQDCTSGNIQIFSSHAYNDEPRVPPRAKHLDLQRRVALPSARRAVVEPECRMGRTTKRVSDMAATTQLRRDIAAIRRQPPGEHVASHDRDAGGARPRERKGSAGGARPRLERISTLNMRCCQSNAANHPGALFVAPACPPRHMLCIREPRERR
jgi:hypothetical protein